MKTILRMILFSAFAIYLTAFWNKGFIPPAQWQPFLEATLIIAVICYLVKPISKVVLLPLNLLTFGLVSVVFFAFLFHILNQKFPLIKIKAWHFPGMTLFKFSLQSMVISYPINLVLSSVSVSAIISILEKLI